MAIKFKITAGAGAIVASAANVVARLGVCANADPASTIYQFDAGQDVVTPLVGGPLAVDALYATTWGGAQHIAVKVPASIAGTISSVTKPGGDTSPTPTIAGSAFDNVSNSPFDAYPGGGLPSVLMQYATGGLPGAAVVNIALDGASYDYTFPLPPALPATQIGTVDVTGITWSTLDGLTLIFTPDGNSLVTVTFGGSVTGESDVLSAFAAHPTLAASFVQQGDTRHLQVTGIALGHSAGTLLSGAGTANAALGFTSAVTTHGTDSTVTIPGTGLTITYPATSPYVTNVVHSFSTTAPRHSKADFDTAVAALNADLSVDFGLVELVQEPVDGTDLASYVADTDATGAAWEGQSAKRFVHFLVPAPSGLGDSAVKAALASEQSRYTTVAARPIYVATPPGLPQGSFLRSAVRPLGTRCAAVSFSEDPGFGGFGPLPGCSMIGPDGVTKAPDENSAVVKLGTSKGPGFTVIKGKAQNGKVLPYFVRGVTRAGSSSLFVDLGVTRMVERAAAIIFQQLQAIENPTFDLNPDGTIQEHDAVSLEDIWVTALKDELVPEHASTAVVTIDRTEIIATTRNLTVTYTVQERGQGEDITATLTLVGELVIDGQTVPAT